MKKCIACEHEIGDDANFCPICGHNQLQDVKKAFEISERAFRRIFRPAFFYGLSNLIDMDDAVHLILDFLCIEQQISDAELAEINTLIPCLSVIWDEDYSKLEAMSGRVSETFDYDLISVKSEKFRKNIVMDAIVERMKNVENECCTDKGKKLVRIALIWIFVLCSGLDASYSEEKMEFFTRISSIFPIVHPDCPFMTVEDLDNMLDEVADIPDCDFEEYKSELRHQLDRGFGDLREGRIDSTDEETAQRMMKARTIAEIILGSSTLQELKKTVTKLQQSAVDGKVFLSKGYDFYAEAQNVAKSLCELESQIRKLEESEGKYSEIAEKIADLSRQERSLLDNLVGFENMYMPFKFTIY